MGSRCGHILDLALLLRVDHAPTLRGNGSIHGFAGRGGFELHTVFAALLALGRVLILHDFLRYLGCCAGVETAMTATTLAIDAPVALAAMLKTCRREITRVFVMTFVLL